LSPGSRQGAPQRPRPNPNPDSNATSVAGTAEARNGDGAEVDGDGDERRTPTRDQLRSQGWTDVTLKRGLPKHLNDEKYLPPILRLVGYFSKLTNLGCVLMNACIIKDLDENDGQLRFIRSLRTEGEGAGDLYIIRTAIKLFTVRRNGTSGKYI
jgi:hypothetical protein